jgi:cleavage and polyadenylation specificity factor subunit 2
MTIPVYKMGQMFLYDAVLAARHQRQGFDLLTLDDIDAMFDHATQLKYSQRHFMSSGRGAGIELTPHAAGHLVGGAIWQINKDAEEILYAVDYNHKKERHLNPAILEALSRPTLLITDAYNAETAQLDRKNRDMQFIESILQTLRGDGDVLLPVDTAGRVFELLVMLEQFWTLEKLSSHYPIVFLTNISHTTIEFAKSQLEWMSDQILNRFHNNRENQFNMKHIQLCHSLSDLDKIKKPRVILTSSPTLEHGFSLDLLLQLAPNPKNMVILTDRSEPDSLTRKIYNAITSQKATSNISVAATYWQRVPLHGIELETFLERRRLEEEEKRELERQEAEKKRAKDLAKIHDYEGEDVDSAKSLYNLWTSYDFHVPSLDKVLKKNHIHPMFPYFEYRSIHDEYGEVIRLEDYANVADNTDATSPWSLVGKGEMGMGMDIDEEEIKEETPTKSVQVQQDLEILCQVKYIDFEGRADGRSYRKILSHVAPKKMILVHGQPDAIGSLASYCEQNLKTCQRVLRAADKQTLDLSSDTSMYRIHLKDELAQALRTVKVGEFELSWLSGVVASRVSAKAAEAAAEDDDKMDLDLEATELAPVSVSRVDPNVTLVGDIRLAEFKQLLSSSGFRTEVNAGVLLVNGVISVRKEEKAEGQTVLFVDGPICEDYFRVRELMYSRLTLL